VESPRLVRWESLTKKDFDAIDHSRAVVLVTCSPIEVHGPHLPMGADALEGEALAERMLRFLPERHRDRIFLKLPYIYAATDSVPQPGSLYFQPSTTITVLSDLGRTLAAQGFRDVLVSNFHGGPRHFLAIEKACTKVNRRHGLRMVSVFSLLISRLTRGTANLDDVLAAIPGVAREDLVGDTHGGIIETSQLLALHGDWVDPGYTSLPRQTVDTWLEQRGERPTAVGRGDPRRLLAMLRSYRKALAFFGECTYSGAPGGASAEIGERILDTLGERAGEACAEILDGTLGPEDCHSPVWRFRFLFLNPLMIRLSHGMLGFRNGIA
jgi:creatinine amidohydrolase/Fe(II)-dependent formamide hydrolase-like protein